MRNKRYSMTFIIMFAFMLLIPTVLNFNGTGVVSVNEIAPDEKVNFDIANGYPPMMLIDSEDDFVTEGWTGDGSAGSPYTLEGVSYTSTVGVDGYIISMRHTRANFTIQNCTFNGQSNYASIYMYNVTNGVVTGCTFNVSYTPVYVFNSPGIVIDGNTMETVSFGGYIYSSPFAIFRHNIIDGFSSHGVFCDLTSPNSIIHDNEIANGTYGYAIQVQSSGTNVTHNNIYSCDSKGIYSYHGDYLNISYNTICNITEEGLFVYLSHHNRIEYNDIHCTLGDGMFLNDAEFTLIANNTIYLSSKSGINYGPSDDVDIMDNEIFACADYGIYLNASSGYVDVTYNHIGWNGINARDDGSSNLWDSNFWSNAGLPPYIITGTATNSDTNPLHFLDTSAPTISDESNIHYFETVTGNYINWTYSDDHPRLWAFELDRIEVDSGLWCGDSLNYYLDIDGLSVGTYNYTFIVQDAPYTNSSDTVIVTVEPYEYDAPIIEGFTDKTLEAGVEGITLQWNATDLHPDTYVLYQNDVPIDDGPYTNAGNITYSLTAMDVSTYNFTCWFNDVLGNSDKHTVWVYFLDTTNPVVNTPDDITYTVGELNNLINWTVEDFYPVSYSIYINGSLNITDTWDGGNIVFNVDGFDAGVYNLTLVAEDESGNTVSDMVFVTVESEITSTTTTSETSTTTETDTLPPTDEGAGMTLAIALGLGGAAVIVVIIVIFMKSKK